MIRQQVQFAVLTGGMSSRFGGNKLDHIVNGKTIFEQTLETIGGHSNLPILVIGKNPTSSQIPFEFHNDIYQGSGPLRGITTALDVAITEYVFIVAGDMPYIRSELIDYLISLIHSKKKVIICINNRFYEPLFAIYHTSIKPYFETCLTKGCFKISDALRNVDKLEISENQWKPYDTTGRSFHNINTPSDIKR